MGITRNRPNKWENRYNQWVIAGKIAVITKTINPYDPDGTICPIYRKNDNELHYSVIGQDYLAKLDLNITELL